MVDSESKPDRLKHLILTQQAIRLSRPVAQEDLTEAVSYANELCTNPRANLTSLAVDIANRHFFTKGSERQISLIPDEKLAQELTNLKEYAINRLDRKLQEIPRSKDDIEADEKIIYEDIAIINESFRALIAQATPKTEN